MSNKPFACKQDGCKETFANEDHCMVHQKRHEMILNVGLANKNQAFADQTPTPTRFIRNCEEVGLFQDLQNVNPFDETFKKAIDHSKNSPEAPFTANSSLNITDDTLHTPHIFPHIQAALTKSNISNDISNSICTDSPLDRSDSPLDRSDGLIIIDDSDEEVDQIIVDINQSNLKALPETQQATGCADDSTVLKIKTVCSTNDSNKDQVVEKITLKDILREKLQTRNGASENIDTSVNDNNSSSEKKHPPYPLCLSQVPKNNILTDTYKETILMHKLPRKRRLMPKATNESIVSSSTETSFLDDVEPDEELVVCSKDDDRKLRNRVAQSRSRQRKKMHYDVLTDQLDKLQSQTDNLRYENKALKKQIHELKKYILTHHEKCAFTGDMTFLKTCLAAEVARRPEYPADAKPRKLLPVLPKSSPTLTPLPLRIHPSRPTTNPIIVAVPPVKIPAKGNVNYIVIGPPPPPPLHVNT